MLGIMVAVFLVGYLCIAMEHKLQVNKAASGAADRRNFMGALYRYGTVERAATRRAGVRRIFVG